MTQKYISEIPVEAIEQKVSDYRNEGGCVWHEVRDCLLNEEVVGKRFYNNEGLLMREMPIKNGQIHGVAYEWDFDDGQTWLLLTEPYRYGLVHGVAKQWGQDGELLGTYTQINGTGYDVWRGYNEKGDIIISEVHSRKDGYPHGYEWWFNDDQCTVYSETHWHKGNKHGIERQWDPDDSLENNCPKFYVDDKKVTLAEYLMKQTKIESLPEYFEQEDSNLRKLPNEIVEEG